MERGEKDRGGGEVEERGKWKENMKNIKLPGSGRDVLLSDEVSRFITTMINCNYQPLIWVEAVRL